MLSICDTVVLICTYVYMYVCLCECIRVTHLIPELSAELSSISDKETEAQ